MRHPLPRNRLLSRVFFWTFVVDYILVALVVHYIGIRHREHDAWMTTTYEQLSWQGAVEFALPTALLTSILVCWKWGKE